MAGLIGMVMIRMEGVMGLKKLKKAKFIEEGQEAFANGVLPFTDNPYQMGTKGYIWWSCGWEIGYIGSKDEALESDGEEQL